VYNNSSRKSLVRKRSEILLERTPGEENRSEELHYPSKTKSNPGTSDRRRVKREKIGEMRLTTKVGSVERIRGRLKQGA